MIFHSKSRSCWLNASDISVRAQGCEQPTSGPQDHPNGSVNLGVAAHITSASSGGPRYDPTLTALQRADLDNGIWLCQTCAKLIDSDVARYTIDGLKEWKRAAEVKAARALEPRRDERRNDSAFSKAMSLMPERLAEMRNDLLKSPLVREFVVLKRVWLFCYPEYQLFTYYYEDHTDLDNKLRILENLALVRDVQGNSDVARFVMEESFAEDLTRT